MSERSPLETEIRRRIATAGPMPVAEYMALCLLDREHGYYTTRDPLGARGDFTTAPEVSQMFGELIGLWAATVWTQMGTPENVRLIELGPGRGTLMNDALRAVQIVPEFHSAIVAHLVEISPVLQAQQEKTLEAAGVTIFWHAKLADVPAGPAIIFANEFFDALPVNQAIKTDRGWHERRIQVDANDQLAFTIAPEPLPFFQTLLPAQFSSARAGAIFEWRGDTEAMEVGRRVADGRGAALVIDYGHMRIRHRGNVPGRRPACLRGSIDRPRRARSHCPRRFSGPVAGRRGHGRERVRADRTIAILASSRHRAARGFTEGQGRACR